MAETKSLVINTQQRATVPIGIDGAQYQMRTPLDLSDDEQTALGEFSGALTRAGSNPTKENTDAAHDALVELKALILPDVPDDVRARLTPFHMADILVFFTQAVPRAYRRSSRAGTPTSRRSNGSTVHRTRKRG